MTSEDHVVRQVRGTLTRAFLRIHLPPASLQRIQLVDVTITMERKPLVVSPS